MRRVAALALALVVAGTRAAHAESFADRLDKPITRPVAQALADSIGRSLPVTSASSGVTFHFDFETGTFERETQILGQLFLERAEPLGRGKWNVAVSWQRVDIESLDGRDLDTLRDPGPPIVDPDNGSLFTVPRFSLGLDTEQVTVSTTYGLTDDIDVNLAVPIVVSRLRLDAVARDVVTGRVQHSRVRASATGVGDIFLRGKYRFLHGRFGSVASGFVLRLPSGNQNDFQGTGEFEVSPFLYASTPRAAVAPGVRVQGYVNAGVDLVATDVDRSEGRVGIGVDCEILERLSLAAAVLGREPFSRFAPPGTFDVTRRNPRTGAVSITPFLGLDSGRQPAWDLSLGGRLDLWRDSVFLVGNVLLPINDAGFRANVVPLLGIEAVF